MRIAASIALLLAAATPISALAADYQQPPILPEQAPLPAQEFNWSGLYGGIHVNTTVADFSTSNIGTKLAREAYYAHVASDLATSFVRLPTDGSDQQNGIGGFVGFNWLWEDVVLGLEADFTHLQNPLRVQASSFPLPDGRRRSRDSYIDQVEYAADARAQLGDYLIVKARGGYAWGRFLPYATLGLVVAKQRVGANYASVYTELALDTQTNKYYVSVQSERSAASNKSSYNVGGAIGVGLDYALLNNLFLRAEYQYIAMADYKNLKTSANTVRVGAALKY